MGEEAHCVMCLYRQEWRLLPSSHTPPTPAPYSVPEMSLLNEEACLLDTAAKAPSLTSGP